MEKLQALRLELTCKTCGAKETFATKQTFMDAIRAHPKGHKLKLKGHDQKMNQTEMDKYFADILRLVQ